MIINTFPYRKKLRENDIKYMKSALSMAKKGIGKTSPNPAVGAVIVRDDRVIASGYHKKAGANHAEVETLSNLKGVATSRDIMYVTLEPCNHQGKTPPCTKAILESGIKNVVVGMKDPNPSVKGGGIEYLRSRGVNVKTGVLEKECRQLLESWIKYSRTGKPFVIAKSALTLDGYSATSTGHSMWVTGEDARQYVHRLRSEVDAVMVGIGTVIADNPLLTSRLKNGKGRDPLRIIVDTHLRIPDNAGLLNDDSQASNYIIAGNDVDMKLINRIERGNTSVIKCPVKDNKVDLTAMLDILGKKSITSILFEGGSLMMGSMIRARLIDKFLIFKAPKLLGGSDGIPMSKGKGPVIMGDTYGLKDINVKKYGEDILISGYPA
jgi:diaminohydroxyphosphoribosylaminopyrimidine deaminase/5-amino-6-(5-phosphoribosylamino)uracil reductase